LLLWGVETTGESIASEGLDDPGKSLPRGVEIWGEGVVRTEGDGIASKGLEGPGKSLLRGVENIGEGVVSS